MDPTDTFLSFADYVREQVGDRRACVKRAPALNHLEDIVWAFWAGEFQGGRFADRIDGTAVHLQSNPAGADVGVDDKYYDEELGYEVLDAEYLPVTREVARQYLCSFEFLPSSMFPLQRGQDPHPPFSDFINMPLDRFLEDENPAARLGFDYLANKLSIRRHDWIATRDGGKAKAVAPADQTNAPTPPLKKKGRPLGSGSMAQSDARLVKMMRKIIKDDPSVSMTAAAMKVVDKAAGKNSLPESKAKRLVERYKKLTQGNSE